ncbi:MAG: peptidase M24, partial [Legionella sp. 21-45-4]
MESVVPRIPNMPNPPVLSHETPELKTPGWQYITVKPGDSLASLFNRAGISSKTLQLILQNNPHAALLTRIKPNQTIQLLLEQHTLKQLILPLANAESLVIEHQGSGYTTTHHFDALHSQNRFISATVKNSLYETAKRNNIPFPLIRKMSEIFHSEINFARDVHTGDQFTLLYKAYFNKDKLIRTGEILALSYTTRNKTYQAVRHEINAHDAEYFTPDGRSLKQGFSRYPLEFSRISSLFSLSRMHPILHYSRPHQGIDLAAPTGTPVHATGDGRIEKIQREAGFGNVVKISHQSTYTSIYAHLLRFEKGL